MVRFIEMFSGIGGFRLGLEKTNNEGNVKPYEGEYKAEGSSRTRSLDAGSNWVEPGDHFRCVWANDIDKYACQIYRKNFGGEDLIEGDIRAVDAGSIPGHDILTAGFPCPSFSVAGKRMGFKDPRGQLFYEICRVAKAKRPKILFLENVRGLLSIDRGQTFKTILQELGNIGYWVEWQVLNSKYYAVPQSRVRVFIIGHLRGSGGREIFPIGESDQVDIREAEPKIRLFHNSGAEIQRVYNPKGIAPTLHSKTGGWQIPKIVADRTRTYAGKGRNLEAPKDIANALSSVRKDNLVLENYSLKGRRIRHFTPTECERLQGFPDGWTEGLSDTQRYNVLGRAVTVNVITYLGERIRERWVLNG